MSLTFRWRLIAGCGAALLAIIAFFLAENRHQARIKETYEYNEKLNQSLLIGITRSGLSMEAPRVEKWVAETAKREGVTREQAQAAIFGIAESAPMFGIKTKEKEKLATLVVRYARRTGGDAGEIRKQAQILAEDEWYLRNR